MIYMVLIVLVTTRGHGSMIDVTAPTSMVFINQLDQLIMAKVSTGDLGKAFTIP